MQFIDDVVMYIARHRSLASKVGGDLMVIANELRTGTYKVEM